MRHRKLECERPKKGSVGLMPHKPKLKWGKQVVAANEDKDENNDKDNPISIISPINVV